MPKQCPRQYCGGQLLENVCTLCARDFNVYRKPSKMRPDIAEAIEQTLLAKVDKV